MVGQSPPLVSARSIKDGLRVQHGLILRAVQAESMEFQVCTKLFLCGSLRCAAERSILRPATLLLGSLHKLMALCQTASLGEDGGNSASALTSSCKAAQIMSESFAEP